MKIHFDNVNPSSRTGPNTFASRLAKQLFELGHEVNFTTGENCDTSLVFIEPTGNLLAPRIIQRLDGIWFKPENFEHNNKRIKEIYKSADHVIWQSEFDKAMTQFWFGEKPYGTVISNGIKINPVSQFTYSSFEQLRSAYKQVFVCSANWHPQKRLRANTELFMKIKSTIEPSSCLIVLGSNPDFVISNKDIFYAGSLPHDVCAEIYSMANWMIHLAWCDHSPNTVVEALSQGTPVICSDVGGTRELVKDFGVVLKDAPYNFELFDYDNPPIIDVSQLRELPLKESLGNHKTIDIKSITLEYLKVF